MKKLREMYMNLEVRYALLPPSVRFWTFAALVLALVVAVAT